MLVQDCGLHIKDEQAFISRAISVTPDKSVKSFLESPELSRRIHPVVVKNANVTDPTTINDELLEDLGENYIAGVRRVQEIIKAHARPVHWTVNNNTQQLAVNAKDLVALVTGYVKNVNNASIGDSNTFAGEVDFYILLMVRRVLT
jgi:hypothetical protein